MLHTVNKSPYSADSFELCLDYASAGDVILLLEDGVYAALKGGSGSLAIQRHMKDKTFAALVPDLKARGITSDKIIAGIQNVDYDGFVTLVAQSDKVQSWL
ncbi:MAG: tRNA 2-thiouridine synthesizing protein B [Saprospiraceae bacterium]|jgi:tRNA 2-thiouridine synthesizing protein B